LRQNPGGRSTAQIPADQAPTVVASLRVPFDPAAKDAAVEFAAVQGDFLNRVK
jgi:hypothetical protein